MKRGIFILVAFALTATFVFTMTGCQCPPARTVHDPCPDVACIRPHQATVVQENGAEYREIRTRACYNHPGEVKRVEPRNGAIEPVERVEVEPPVERPVKVRREFCENPYTTYAPDGTPIIRCPKCD